MCIGLSTQLCMLQLFMEEKKQQRFWPKGIQDREKKDNQLTKVFSLEFANR